MSHWYKFQISGIKEVVVCRANRSMEVKATIKDTLGDVECKLYGCIDKVKITDLSSDKSYLVCNSTTNLTEKLTNYMVSA